MVVGPGGSRRWRDKPSDPSEDPDRPTGPTRAAERSPSSHAHTRVTEDSRSAREPELSTTMSAMAQRSEPAHLGGDARPGIDLGIPLDASRRETATSTGTSTTMTAAMPNWSRVSSFSRGMSRMTTVSVPA